MALRSDLSSAMLVHKKLDTLVYELSLARQLGRVIDPSATGQDDPPKEVPEEQR